MKLHIGGKTPKEGWKILNIQKFDSVDYVGDLTDLTQFSENSFNEIYASHVLEHVGQRKVKQTLLGINRILTKRGKLYISVPDMDILCKMFIDKKAGGSAKFDVMRMMFGGQTDQHDFHYFGWNFQFLKAYLEGTNFRKIEQVKSFDLFNDSSDVKLFCFPISLNVIAYKQ